MKNNNWMKKNHRNSKKPQSPLLKKNLTANLKLNQKKSNFSLGQDIAEKHGGIWLYGKHPVFLALEKKRREIFQIFVTKNSVLELEKFLENKNLQNLKNRIKIVDLAYINQLVDDNAIHQNFVLNCSQLPQKSQNNLLEEIEKIAKNSQKLPPLLIMDQLRDPHNVGAIIRSACAFGVKKIIFPEHNFPKESAVINKTSSGMIENVDLYLVVNLNNLILKLKDLGYWCIGLAGEAKQGVEKIGEYKNVALVIGSEGEGIRDLVRKNCDLLVRIEMDEAVESLNASVAASIALREIFCAAK